MGSTLIYYQTHFRKNNKIHLSPDYQLEVRDLDEEDAGEYICEVDFYGKSMKVAHNLEVLGDIITTYFGTLIIQNNNQFLNKKTSFPNKYVYFQLPQK